MKHIPDLLPRVVGAVQETHERFLNLYTLICEQRDGKRLNYTVASRAQNISELTAISDKIKADAVVINAIHEDPTTGKHTLVMVNQYRYPIGRRIYELPAGLIEKNEVVFKGAMREMFEETGLQFALSHAVNDSARPCFSSPGMTDESVSILFGTCKGTPTNANQEASEDIQVVLADVEECQRILLEEEYDIRAFWAMKLFIAQNS